MRKLKPLNFLAVFLVSALSFTPLSAAPAVSAAPAASTGPAVSSAAVQAPVLLWQHGGCYNSWCQTGWYSSPAVADLKGDGKMEVIGSAYSIFALNGEDGKIFWKTASGHDVSTPAAGDVGRTWAGVVVADVDGDGLPEIVTAHSGGYVSVYDRSGHFKPGWPQNPVGEEFRSLAVADLDGDGKMEIAAGRATSSGLNTWVFNSDGSLRAGWPQRTISGDTWGVYNNNISIGDLIPGGSLEVIVPSDTITIAGYTASGAELPVNSMYYGHSGNHMTTWVQVPAYVDPTFEVQGWGPCYDVPTARANFANGPADIVDVNGDGIPEVVAIGNVHDCHTDPYTDLYYTPYIFNADRSRFKSGTADWSVPPVNTGAPISEDYNVIESAAPNPVTVDLDGDGKLEILYASYDGRLHAFWLDKTEHGSWPFAVNHPADGYKSFASEPVVADLNNDGKPEVIFASWTQNGSHATGKLYILDNMGNPLQAVSLPAAFGGDWNGALAAPTLADINGDGNLEVVLNTADSGLVAYTLPGTANATILWGTGRGNYQRTGTLPGSLAGSSLGIAPLSPAPGSTLTVTIRLINPGIPLTGVTVTDVLPPGLNYLGSPIVSAGTFKAAGNILTWTGNVPTNHAVTVTFLVKLSGALTGHPAITDTFSIAYGQGQHLTRQASLVVNGINYFLPLAAR